jgi:hypothetical protein
MHLKQVVQSVSSSNLGDYLTQPMTEYKKDLSSYLASLAFEIGFVEQTQEGLKKIAEPNKNDRKVWPMVSKVEDLAVGEVASVYRVTIRYQNIFYSVTVGLEWIATALTAILRKQYQSQRRPMLASSIQGGLALSATRAVSAELNSEVAPTGKNNSEREVVGEILANLRSGVLDDWQAASLLGVSISTVRRYRKNSSPLGRVPTLTSFCNKTNKTDIFMELLQDSFRNNKKIAYSHNLTVHRINQCRDELVLLLLTRLVSEAMPDVLQG